MKQPRITNKLNPLTLTARLVLFYINHIANAGLREAYMNRTVSTIDGVVYVPAHWTAEQVAKLPESTIFAHEKVHILRASQTRFWQLRYILSAEFRLQEECIAYLVQHYWGGASIASIAGVLYDIYELGHEYHTLNVAMQQMAKRLPRDMYLLAYGEALITLPSIDRVH